MSDAERIVVNGHELTAFDLPPKPTDEYTVHVDGLGEITVTRDGPTMHDRTAESMSKMVDGLCIHIADFQAENEKLRELVRDMWRTFMGCNTTAAQRAELRERMRELGVDFDG